jgi:FixJ family two-component response regulator
MAPPESRGLAEQTQLVAAGCRRPLVFLAAEGTIATSVSALRAGAINVLTSSCGADVLLAAVLDALTVEGAMRRARDCELAATSRISKLTEREHQVLIGLVDGKLNKQIAAELGVVENTVKAHRARVMQKLDIRCLAELVVFACAHSLYPPAGNVPRELHRERSSRTVPRGTARQSIHPSPSALERVYRIPSSLTESRSMQTDHGPRSG